MPQEAKEAVDDQKDATAPEGDAAAEAGAKPGRLKKMLTFVSVALACVGGAVTVGVVAFPDPPGSGTADVAELPKDKFMVAVPKVIVNLAESNGLRLLQAAMSLELEHPDLKIGEPEFQNVLPKAQDRIIKVLSALTARDIEGAAAKEFIQTRLKDDLNNGLLTGTPYHVTAIYFTEFVVQ
jgi:flagellar basal body-associated protein FliL